MSRKVFVAGASGVIGKALLKLLVAADYSVYGATRRAEKVKDIEATGATAVVVDVYDAERLNQELVRIQPWAVIHQLTDLPRGLSPELMAKAVENNARIRTEGTRNLVAAARAAGATRLIAQSIAWAYRPGETPYLETCPLDVEAQCSRGVSVGGVAALEQQVLSEPALNGTILRYGQLYGPDTGTDEPTGTSPVHVQAAARAALLALQTEQSGVFNITQDSPTVSNEKAKRVLGWSPTEEA
ncbi:MULTISPECIES: NAD-dependent epimerase/dehydratase family protein [Pseudomonas syringae group]|uniref:dTDP-glucose 4,6-dehydratase n=2 Tax=Pseudomonas syringae group TaxID=136849 RepID=A0A2K4WMJ5_PSESX|nr:MULTISPECIES: NAD(P)-dependent oxidoreductase [Pseudomonas syringae group]AVB17252.1 NAD(P)-dependent oxidoreductase [Pseudomonas amygdali pv. morsprunorum]KWS58917.1 dTDP-glucose 4,6-dehydratase [Pseudomonas amygdali pv. morsprunorum]KWS61302.1 dTDP-glucose 4,6-dehydratase [Pseudomonas amygdali pv. morsprunorum]MDT3222871.1 NAD(P)-dependent oxidoreductase [Pseudomonas amygdali pv. morsprunorum]MDT3240921.1 NAD(P)-dependent oxidoreductase [Pseudomonas amygdali pv. morsprunorum]